MNWYFLYLKKKKKNFCDFYNIKKNGFMLFYFINNNSFYFNELNLLKLKKKKNIIIS